MLPGRRGAAGIALQASLVVMLLSGSPVRSSPQPPPTESSAQSEAPSRPAPNQSIALDEPADADVPPEWLAAPIETKMAAEPEPMSSDTITHSYQLPPRPADSRRTTSRDNREGSPWRTETPWYATGLGSLTIVLTLVAALFLLVRRWAPGAKIGDSGVMRVAARIPLGTRQQLALVQVGRRLILTGIAGDAISSLGEISDPDEVAELLARCGGRGRSPVVEFGDALHAAKTEYDEPAVGSDSHLAAPRAHPATGERPVSELLKRVRALHARKP